MHSMKKRTGFTLIEVLVASGVSLLLGLTVFQIFYQSRRSIEGAADRISLIQATRPALARVSGYVTSACNRGSTDPTLFPEIDPSGQIANNEFGVTMYSDDPSTWAKVLCFSTTEDFFDPNFDPEGIMDINNVANNLDIYVTDAHRIYQYMIWWESDSNGHDFLPNLDKKLCLARLSFEPDPEIRGSNWGKTAFAGDPASFIDPNFEPQIISHSLEEVSFYRLTRDTIECSVLATGTVTTTGDKQDKEYRSTVSMQLPTITD